jgi:sterol desaturase/sphingolipid hydroxylase (fatty acid hydroxylase superfamily)
MKKMAPFIDLFVVFAVVAAGLFSPDWLTFYTSAAQLFLIISIPLFGFSFITYRFSTQYGNKIQENRKGAPDIVRESMGTARAVLVVSFLAAWPVSLSKLGYETGLVWTVEEMGVSWWMVVIQMYLGIVAIDAWTYWKHRLLHTKFMYPFHMHHHTFKDPTPFAGFAVGPVETILTFWPLLLICIPEAKHFAPFYYTAIVLFVLLNLYLHSGVTFKTLEKVLPKLMLNSSAWHNIHHSDVIVNYGEVSFFWDKMCKTNKK